MTFPKRRTFEGLAEQARSGPPPDVELEAFSLAHDDIWVEEARPAEEEGWDGL